MLIGWDTETHLISDDSPVPPVVVNSFHGPELTPNMGYGVGLSPGTLLDTSPRLLTALLQLAAQRKAVLVAHNAAFDVVSAMRTWPHLAELLFRALDADGIICTKLAVRLRKLAQTGNASRRGTSLAACAAQYLNEDLAKGEDTWRLRYNLLDGIPLEHWPDDAKQYSAKDAEVVYRLAKKLWPIPSDTCNQTRYSVAFRVMSAVGMRVDYALAESERTRVQVEYDSLLSVAKSRGYVRDKGSRDLKAIRGAVGDAYTTMGQQAPQTKGGSVATDGDTLAGLPDKHPAKVLKDLAYSEKILGTYLNTYVDTALAGRPIRPSVDVLKNTGRTSMSSPNLQNVPRAGKLREVFIPRDGYVFASADLDSAEMRSLGQACLDTVGRSRLADLFIRNPRADAHLALAAGMCGITLHEAKKRFEAKDPVIVDARQRAKAGNFGFAGGMGPDKFVLAQHKMGAEYTTQQATELRTQYFNQWDEIPAYFDWVNKAVQRGGEITLPISGRTRAGCTFCNGANTGFQGRTSDVAKLWCYMIVRESLVEKGSALYGSRLVHFVHDEVIVEASRDKAHDAAMRVSELAEKAGSYHMPDIPTVSTPCLMSRWYKKAEPAYDAQGRLIPWQPSES